jgi:hypothetical protein
VGESDGDFKVELEVSSGDGQVSGDWSWFQNLIGCETDDCGDSL